MNPFWRAYFSKGVVHPTPWMFVDHMLLGLKKCMIVFMSQIKVQRECIVYTGFQSHAFRSNFDHVCVYHYLCVSCYLFAWNKGYHEKISLWDLALLQLLCFWWIVSKHTHSPDDKWGNNLWVYSQYVPCTHFIFQFQSQCRKIFQSHKGSVHKLELTAHRHQKDYFIFSRKSRTKPCHCYCGWGYPLGN